ncbi:ChaN family lipoprotein [Roseospira visakhapatnamensis]|uniref:Putative iron-regulated protein n=1 Tax=Roseospira visakhapatnamensis TaxID=390880 RepID=A0A7W6RCU7_9PROT|nr:ChaN family lipoprotein [Roseospira visakhapatnamensis]MBB4266170.1 putative iron-regulated protein [Roseospira visakhapatnamensis]
MPRFGLPLSLVPLLAMILLPPMPASAQSTPPWGTPWETTVRAAHPDVGTLRAGPSGTARTPAEAVTALAGADLVLLGEKHDNPDHHRARAWILERLVEAGRRPAVVMEMLDSTQAEALAAYQARPDADAAGLGEAVGWARTGWPDWTLYQPIAAVALDAGLPILPGNLPTAEVRRIARDGAEAVLGAAGLAPRGLDTPLPDALRESLGREILDSHCGMLPEPAVPGMIAAQRARDGEMARALLAAAARPDTDGALLIAGNGHVRADRGVPWTLARLAPDLSIATLGVLEVGEAAAPDTPPFDLVWWTPALEDVDPCEKFAAQLERLRERHAPDGHDTPGHGATGAD